MNEQLQDPWAVEQRTRTNGHHRLAAPPLIRASDIRELADPVEQWIASHPAAALATAFLTGVVLAWLVKRK